MHQLPVPTLGYLPLWLETLRLWLDADSVAALWCPAPETTEVVTADAAAAGGACWYAPQASVAACERLAAGAALMPPAAALQHALVDGAMLRAHARHERHERHAGHRQRGGKRCVADMLRRPAELSACLADGDVLDVCLLPVARAADARPPCDDTAALCATSIGALRLLVSRGRERPSFTTREIGAFEMAAAEFSVVPERPQFPPFGAMVPASPEVVQETTRAHCADIAGTLVWRGRQPEWADPAALALMRRVWRHAPGRGWPDACVVVQACQRLADDLTRYPGGNASALAQVGARVPVPGGTLHLHATHLCGMGGGATERVRIALHLVVPPAMRLLQRLCETALTPVQREIAMRLLAGQSRTATREACAIGVQTLKTHLSLMRARLDPVRDASLLLGLGGMGAAGAVDATRGDASAARP
ncbi:hypothetical protein UC34_02580 [Pandoraea vervacti]|uniref:HTH luxR-type domain-containing protein n=1 Tax=Pandoraea vervacti TaxID=656178 RepID=A0ABM5SUT3_9BURK|nr:hypothetical protein [Pandoraea vervacti]AJP56186.1 hypothetical protein UC34_02580 [Pandoraea vervacti]